MVNELFCLSCQNRAVWNVVVSPHFGAQRAEMGLTQVQGRGGGGGGVVVFSQ